MSGAALATQAGLFDLGLKLQGEGRVCDALTIFDHLSEIAPGNAQILRAQLAALGAEGRVLEALGRLVAARRGLAPQEMMAEIQAHSGAALDRFNAHLNAGEIDQAEPYAAALAELAPGNVAVLGAALSCNLALGRPEPAQRYAQALLSLDGDFAPARQAMADACRRSGDVEGEIAHRLFLALSPKNDIHPLLRLKDIHDLSSLILRRPLTGRATGQLEALLAAARFLEVPVEPGSEFEGWAKHYQLLLRAVDLAAVRGATPAPVVDGDIEYAAADGSALTGAEVRAKADGLSAEAVFFVAADEAYVDLYARWYALSVLRHVDVSSLVVVHVIGGAGRLGAIAARVGVDDPRLVFAADVFDAEAASAVRCYETPPKGLMAKPVAHYQSVRFQRLGGLLDLVERPVFVSDIDLLLQRGVLDLLARTAADDVVLNENEISEAAASRITANLLLVRPTPAARTLLRFLRAYLDRALAGEEVSRWIDQLALLLAWQHLAFQEPDAKVGYFDTTSDINNVMYQSYQAHPFRFLSLYHGFDTSSLENDPRVLGGEAPAKPPAKRARKASR
jgi:tetratricopeptide (TPR) repeat protein